MLSLGKENVKQQQLHPPKTQTNKQCRTSYNIVLQPFAFIKAASVLVSISPGNSTNPFKNFTHISLNVDTVIRIKYEFISERRLTNN